MSAMKAELGEDAVILHSKKYKEGGILGIGSREVVEITAAVEESSLPKKIESPKRVAPSSVVNRYKTDGTAQGVESAEKISAEDPPHSMQTDALNEKVSAQKNFEDALQEAQENPPKTIPAYNQPVEEPKPVEEKPAPVEQPKLVEEKPAPVEEPKLVEEKPAPVEQPKPVEEKPAPVEQPKLVEASRTT